MRTRVRMWRVVKWASAAATVVLFIVWIGSVSWSASYAGDCWIGYGSFSIGFESGAYRVFEAWGNAAVEYPHGWHVDEAQEPFAWWPSFVSTGRYWGATIPIWALVMVTMFIAVATRRLDTRSRRRARLNQCACCGYDRAGLVGGAKGAACPECGSEP